MGQQGKTGTRRKRLSVLTGWAREAEGERGHAGKVN
jgi:hypothetical protein